MQLVIELLRHSHEHAEKEINSQIDNLFKIQSEMFPLNSINSEQSNESTCQPIPNG